MKSLISILLAILLLLAWSNHQEALAQIPPPQQLFPSTINDDQDFGFSVDVYGDVAQRVEEQKLEASSRAGFQPGSLLRLILMPLPSQQGSTC